jgi:hypothetical protein
MVVNRCGERGKNLVKWKIHWFFFSPYLAQMLLILFLSHSMIRSHTSTSTVSRQRPCTAETMAKPQQQIPKMSNQFHIHWSRSLVAGSTSKIANHSPLLAIGKIERSFALKGMLVDSSRQYNSLS